jgi:hypothetical protein
LYLARQGKSIKLNITAGHRLMATPGIKGPYPEYLVINIVNTGHRDVQITNIGWKVGFFKKQMQHAIQLVEPDGISSHLPVWLKYGEQANYYIPLGVKREWLETFTIDFYKHHPQSRVKHTKIWVSTSLGKTLESTIENGLQKIILEYIENKRSAEKTESVHTN